MKSIHIKRDRERALCLLEEIDASLVITLETLGEKDITKVIPNLLRRVLTWELGECLLTVTI